MAYKGKLQSLLIAAQNNVLRTNWIKAKIDNTQQNSKCDLCGDRGVYGVMTTVRENEHGDPSSNLWRGSLLFTQRSYYWERYESNNSSSRYG